MSDCRSSTGHPLPLGCRHGKAVSLLPPLSLPLARPYPYAILTYRAPLGTQAMNSLLRKSSLVTRGALRCLPAPATHRLDDRQTRMFAGREEQNAHNFGTEPHAPFSHITRRGCQGTSANKLAFQSSAMRVMLSMPNFHTRARWHSLVFFALKIRSESTRI